MSTQQTISFQYKSLFFRLPNEYDWRKLLPAGVRDIIIIKLSISHFTMGIIELVRSDFAKSPFTNEAREALLNAATSLFPFGAKLEPASNRTLDIYFKRVYLL